MLLQGVEECRGKAEIALHEFLGVLRTVHSGKVEYEVAVAAPLIELLGGGVEVVFIHGINLHVAIPASLPILNIIELGTEVSTHKTFCSCN